VVYEQPAPGLKRCEFFFTFFAVVASRFARLRVEVVDPTEWVRDEAARDSIMKQTLSWPVHIDELLCEGDITGDGIVNISDLLVVINQWGACAGCVADIDGNNVVNVIDLLIVINAWGICP
jgi:hypothetical protein